MRTHWGHEDYEDDAFPEHVSREQLLTALAQIDHHSHHARRLSGWVLLAVVPLCVFVFWQFLTWLDA